MVEKKSLEKDFSFLRGRADVLAVLLYGSAAKGGETPRSDVDICIVAPGCKDTLSLFRDISSNVDIRGKKYDVRIFEELPLYIQIQVINNHDVVYARDIYELYEYFYFIRRLWQDQAHRQELTKEELAGML